MHPHIRPESNIFSNTNLVDERYYSLSFRVSWAWSMYNENFLSTLTLEESESSNLFGGDK